MLGRGAGDHGESACKVGVEDGFQREARKAAGGSRAAVSFGSSSLATFCDGLIRTEGISGCIRLRGREKEQEEVAGVPDVVGIGEALRRYLRTSTSNFVGLGRLEQGKKGQRGEEIMGIL
jgi:hypothetical protein